MQGSIQEFSMLLISHTYSSHSNYKISEDHAGQQTGVLHAAAQPHLQQAQQL